MQSGGQPSTDYGSMWQTYSAWQQEDEQLNASERSKMRARLAASGQRPGSDAYINAEAEQKRKAEERANRLAQSETAKMLTDNWNASKAKRERALGDPLGYSQRGKGVMGSSNQRTVRQYLEGIVGGWSSAQIAQREQWTNKLHFGSRESTTRGEFGTDMMGNKNRVHGYTTRRGAAQYALGELDKIEAEEMPDFYGEAKPIGNAKEPDMLARQAGAQKAMANRWMGRA